MSYCLNPNCSNPTDTPIDKDTCNDCGASLIVQKRYRSSQLLGKSQLALTLEVEDLHCSNSTKVLKILLTNYPKAVKLFQQEAIILQQIDHPGIPKVEPGGYFIHQTKWQDEALHCLVMEKIAGLNLEQWLEKRNKQPISDRQAIDWLKQLLEIINHIHQQQYFHRDIKPANIILQPDGQLALIDFGAARKTTATYLGKVGINKGVTSIGTPGYMAPEQIDGGALPQSDFFALGRTFIHLCTGKHPLELRKSPQTGELIWRTEAPNISEQLADLIDCLVNPLPGKRPHNTQIISNCLADVQNLPNNKVRQWQKRFSQLSTVPKLGLLLFPTLIIGSLVAVRSNINLDRSLCNNLTCINRDPIDNKCDLDSQTITSNIGNYQASANELKAYRIELRYSERCNSTWARTEAPPHSTHYAEDTQGQKYGVAKVPVDQWTRHYADMAPGKNIEIRACAKPVKGNVRCTNFVKLEN